MRWNSRSSLAAVLAISTFTIAACSESSKTAPPTAVNPTVENSAAAPAPAAVTENASSKEPAATETIKRTAAPKPLTDEELKDGWISLFDGETLFGWIPGTKANWSVKEGVIEVSEGEKGLLCTTSRFSDYVFKVEFRFAPKTNSGIFLHTPIKPTAPESDCYELNIAEPAISPFPTGSFVKRQKAEVVAEPDKWHAYEVTVQGDKCVVKLNGEVVLEYTDPKPLRRGHIGLQYNEGKAEFRNIKLKPLGLASLFNGRDLEGWNEPAMSKSKFTVTPEGWLDVKDGKGYLETKASFGDFVFQMEGISHAAGLNSGIFFRCIPGQEMNGYESQIQNAFKNDDRTQPADCGTGGIFRRINARLVAADDLTWFHKTIVTDGKHVSVWVNGYQVTDWTDERPADENPRKGSRTEPGTIQIQGHDPTTHLSFRNLRAVELPARAE